MPFRVETICFHLSSLVELLTFLLRVWFKERLLLEIRDCSPFPEDSKQSHKTGCEVGLGLREVEWDAEKSKKALDSPQFTRGVA